jgi:predicted dehydrogenase/nucleoside-diphosphate-sugar epimerase
MTLRIGFLGAGQMAQEHAAAIGRAGHDATIVGVYDRDGDRAAAFATLTGATAYTSEDALFTEGRPDILHVCTPPAAHFESALAALRGGAHVYVEKPFTLQLDHAEQILDEAARLNRSVCAGHQLLRDPAFGRLNQQVGRLGMPVQVDSHFAFRPVGMSIGRTAPSVLATALLDILPHPLYALVSMLERFAPAASIEVAWSHATPIDLQAVLRAGDIVGRLSVSLRARPIASWLTVVGTEGSLTCDFARSMTVGVPNAGTEALEKLLNPMVDGAALVGRSAVSAYRRITSGTGYAGLAELIHAFHRAAANGTPSPVSPSHLLTVTALFEQLAARVNAACESMEPASAPAVPARVGELGEAPLVAVTGAAGFLGAEITRALPYVRGIGRRKPHGGHGPAEWIRADLSRGLDAESLRGVDVVVHAAAETSGGFPDHQRNSIDATQHLLNAMHQAGVSRLVLVSSLSVIRPPKSGWERQNERTPRPADPQRYGAYTWGKCRQEELIETQARALGIDVRVVRPGALIDRRAPDLPGLVGRRLFGDWHLGLGRPGLPTAVCDVDSCASVIAWCATHFEDAPQVVNLFDPRVRTRRDLLSLLRSRGWRGRMLWVPISVIASGVTAAQTAFALLKGRRPKPVDAWSVLRPRRYDGNLAVQMLTASGQGSGMTQPRETAVAV